VVGVVVDEVAAHLVGVVVVEQAVGDRGVAVGDLQTDAAARGKEVGGRLDGAGLDVPEHGHRRQVQQVLLVGRYRAQSRREPAVPLGQVHIDAVPDAVARRDPLARYAYMINP
jgi:hypothetical protein